MIFTPGAIAGITLAVVVIAVALASTLYYVLDAQYLNYGNEVYLSVNPSDGSGPLYMLLRPDGTVTVTAQKSEATHFTLQRGDGAKGVLVYGVGTAPVQTSFFTVRDTVTQRSWSIAQSPNVYSYLTGETELGTSDTFALFRDSTDDGGTRPKPGDPVRFHNETGVGAKTGSVLQYQSQLANGLPGVSVCSSASDPEASDQCSSDVVWTISR